MRNWSGFVRNSATAVLLREAHSGLALGEDVNVRLFIAAALVGVKPPFAPDPRVADRVSFLVREFIEDHDRLRMLGTRAIGRYSRRAPRAVIVSDDVADVRLGSGEVW